MNNFRPLKIIFMFCAMVGMHFSMHAEEGIELQLIQLHDKKAGVNLFFPEHFEEDEMLLNELLFRVVKSHLPKDMQASLSFNQEGNVLSFTGLKDEMTLLQRQIITQLSEGIKKEEFIKESIQAQWVSFEDLNEWAHLASPVMIFAAESYLNWIAEEVEAVIPEFLFTRSELGDEVPELTFVNNQGTHHFYALRLTPDDSHNISKLIKNLADLSLWELLKKSRDMKKLGNKVDPVHPFRFLGHIFSNHDLKKRMPKIKSSHFKWVKFTDGLCDRLSKEARRNDLNRFIPGFCQVVCCNQDVIEDFVRRHDWHGMLNYLMD